MTDDAASEPVKEAVEHLQQGVLEVIRASRALLDLAEELVADPAPLAGLAHLVTDLAGKGRARTEAAGGDDDPPVQRIRIS